MSRKTLVVLVLCGVLAVAAVAGVVYGVLTQHARPLLLVCWDQAGLASYPSGTEVEPGECEAPVPLQWVPGARPLGVHVAGAHGAPVEAWQQRATVAAVDAINAQVGCEVLRLRLGAMAISMEWGHAAEAGDPVADCRHVGRHGQATAATIRLRNVGSEPEAASIAAHELGHALGLGHDESGDSLMRPLQPDDLLPGLPQLYLNDASVAALRAEFCRD